MSFWIEPAAGALGALSATLILHPLDTLKVTLQSNNLNIKSTVRSIASNKSWYAGVAANLSGNVVAWSLYFMFYSQFKEKWQNPFLAASFAGASTLLFSNPLFVAKTRMITEPKYYSGLLQCLTLITKQDGLKGLYSGFGLGLFGTVHGGVQFYAYEQIKHFWKLDSNDFSTYQYLLASGSSKIIATVVTYPYQVLRTRIQQRNNQHTIVGIVKHIYSNFGLVGFYRGLLPGFIRVLPSSMIVLTSYEGFKRVFKDLS